MPSDALSAWKAHLHQGLRGLEARSQRRSLAEIRGVNFCSNDYLGLAENSELRADVAEAVRDAGKIGGTGSRLLSGQTEEWRELEEAFAEFVGTESSLFFTTGYAANLGLLASLVGKRDVVFSDERNHASLIDGMRLSGARKVIYPHLNLNALEDALRREANAPCRRLIVSESVFSMDGDIAPLVELAGLAEKYNAALILDEAHATGVHGPTGHGLAAAAGITSKVLAIIHTCGKALASAGAFVCGPAVLKEHLLNHARTFIFSTALPPYFAAQIKTAMRLAEGMNEERESLLQRAAEFRGALQAEGFDTAGAASQIVPIILGDNEATLDAAEHLQREGFAVRGIRPPTVAEGGSRLRLSLTTRISQQELSRLVRSLVAWRSRQTSLAHVRHA
ncbi:MAG TPA: 8-amino-7-oxononanoate synthase [Candidatus Sulfotelmatobacter sp.]|jgi:8-amino-7-oxononanoate synthase|nr:8-amino-7-oxononanoate synthase [Candidatus Sulfotelmatobacter sp.]